MKRLEADYQLSRLRRRTRSTWKIVQRQSDPLHFPHDILHLIRSSGILRYPLGMPYRVQRHNASPVG
jgi:hypothetical protein